MLRKSVIGSVTKQSYNAGSMSVDIASRFVPRGRNDEKSPFGADSKFLY